MKILRTNNYKIQNVNNCPKCNLKLEVQYNLDISFFMFKTIKDFKWKKYFIKNDVDTGAYHYDSSYTSHQSPISVSTCGNYIDSNKNPQRTKIRTNKVFKDGRKNSIKTCTHIYCDNCGYSKFIENTSYLDILKEKI